MNVFKKKTPPAVQAAAAAPADAVQKALKDNETKDLVDAMTLEHGAVQSDAEHLEIQRKYQQRLGLLRQGKKDDGLIGTLLSTQEDKVQDAQIALNRSMGRLTHKSLALLVENTSVIGLHGTQQALQGLMAQDWLKGMRDHTQATELLPAPANAPHRSVQRRQFKTNADRLRRRRMQRKGETAEQAAAAIPDSVERRPGLPFVQLRSSSTGQAFCLCVEHGPLVGQAVAGDFNAYGLGQGATVPWF